MAKSITGLVYKDSVVPAETGASDLEGATPIHGDFEVNGHKVVIGIDLHAEVADPESGE